MIVERTEPIILVEAARPGLAAACGCCMGNERVLSIVLGRSYGERSASSTSVQLCAPCRDLLFEELAKEIAAR